MIVQGVRPITLALESALSPRALLLSNEKGRSQWAERTISAAEAAGASMFLVDSELMRELGEKDDDTPEVLLIVEIPPDDLSRIPVSPNPLIVALDRPASPGNVGSIIRSVDALGGQGVVITGRAADPYDPKALRASTGSTLMLPTARLAGVRPVLEWVNGLRTNGINIQILGTEETGEHNVWDVDLTRPTLIVTGNEHSGMSAAWKDACDVLTQIPMTGHASSLNAANATSVLLYEASRQRHPLR